LREAINKLTDVMVEEFDSVREDLKNDMFHNYQTLIERIEKVEIGHQKIKQDFV
jgi:hypothetical protein